MSLFSFKLGKLGFLNKYNYIELGTQVSVCKEFYMFSKYACVVPPGSPVSPTSVLCSTRSYAFCQTFKSAIFWVSIPASSTVCLRFGNVCFHTWFDSQAETVCERWNSRSPRERTDTSTNTLFHLSHTTPFTLLCFYHSLGPAWAELDSEWKRRQGYALQNTCLWHIPDFVFPPASLCFFFSLSTQSYS